MKLLIKLLLSYYVTENVDVYQLTALNGFQTFLNLYYGKLTETAD